MNDECYDCEFIKGCDRAKNLNTEKCKKYFRFVWKGLHKGGRIQMEEFAKQYNLKMVIIVDQPEKGRTAEELRKKIEILALKSFDCVFVEINRDCGASCQITFIPIRGKMGVPTVRELNNFEMNLSIYLNGYREIVFHNSKGHSEWGVVKTIE